MKKLINIELPFSGFYNTIHDSNIDRAIEDGFNYDYEKDEDKELTAAERDAIFMADINWEAIQLEYCEHFVQAFGDQYGLELTFDTMTSPKEYNFSTDRLFCKVPEEQIDGIRKAVEAHKDWPEYIKRNFTDSDGFWSNYDNDYRHEDWTRKELDECQYEVILRFWLNNISEDTGGEGWDGDEYWLTEHFEMMNWDSIIKAHETIEEYIKNEKGANK